MHYYHGSKHRFDELMRKQASAGDGIKVPEEELLNAIYLTPDVGFAIAVASNPEGYAHIDTVNNQVTFQHPDQFSPEGKIWVYTVDISRVPHEHIQYIDEKQIAIVNLESITPDEMTEMKAGEILKFYELPQISKEGEVKKERRDEEFRNEEVMEHFREAGMR